MQNISSEGDTCASRCGPHGKSSGVSALGLTSMCPYLEEHAGDSDHGKAAVVELLQLHVRDLRLRLTLEEVRAEPVVTNDIVGVVAEYNARPQALRNEDGDEDLAEHDWRELRREGRRV